MTEVEPGLELRRDVEEGLTHILELTREPSLQGLPSEVQPMGGSRLRHLQHRFGLDEVHFSVHHRPTRELSGLCQARTRALRGIQQVVGVSDHGIVARLKASEPRALDIDAEAWETDPVVLDSALQCMVLWVRQTKGASALPCYVDSYRQYRPFAGEVTVHMDFKPSRTARGTFEATLVGEDGDIVATLSGAEYTSNPGLNPVFRADA